jgi:chromosome segregation ATPase
MAQQLYNYKNQPGPQTATGSEVQLMSIPELIQHIGKLTTRCMELEKERDELNKTIQTQSGRLATAFDTSFAPSICDLQDSVTILSDIARTSTQERDEARRERDDLYKDLQGEAEKNDFLKNAFDDAWKAKEHAQDRLDAYTLMHANQSDTIIAQAKEINELKGRIEKYYSPEKADDTALINELRSDAENWKEAYLKLRDNISRAIS